MRFFTKPSTTPVVSEAQRREDARDRAVEARRAARSKQADRDYRTIVGTRHSCRMCGSAECNGK